MASVDYIARSWLNVLNQIFIILVLVKGSITSPCRMGSIRSGYRLKRGLDQDNITPLGTHSSLDACYKICCYKNTFDYGVFDGSQCYGIVCESDVDKRCVLLRDGNARFTIFKINRKKKRKKRKGTKSHSHHSRNKVSNSYENVDIISKNKNNKSIYKETFSKTKSHRKHNKRRLLHNHKTAKRDFSASYTISNQTFPYDTPRVKIKPINHITALPFQPVIDMSNKDSSLGEKRTSSNDINNKISNIPLYIPPVSSPDIYNTVARNMITSVPSFTSKNILQSNIFSTSQRDEISNPSPLNDEILKSAYPSSTNQFSNIFTKNVNEKQISFQTPSIQNQSRLKSMFTTNQDTPLQKTLPSSLSLNKPLQKVSLSLNFQGTPLQKTLPSLNTPLQSTPPSLNFQVSNTSKEFSTNFQPTSYPVKKVFLDKDVLLGSEVKPLSQFPMDAQSNDVRDVIPHPFDNQEISRDDISRPISNNGEELITKDSSIDVPFSSDLQIPKTTSSYPAEEDRLISKAHKTSAMEHMSFPLQNQKSQKNQKPHKKVSENGDGFNENIPLAFQTENEMREKKQRANILKRNDIPRDQKTPINVRKAIVEINELRQQIEGLLKKSSNDKKFLVKKKTKRKHIHQKVEGCLNPLGVHDRFAVDDSQMTSSSYEPDSPAYNGRLNIKPKPDVDMGQSWCAQENATTSGEAPFIQVDFRKKQQICRIATQGSEAKEKWVKRYNLAYSDNAETWIDYNEKGNRKLFIGNEDASDTTYHNLQNPISARYLRFIPSSWSGTVPCMRVEAFNASVVDTDGEKISRSSIPKSHAGLIIDLDFEKIDDSIVLDRSSFGNNGFLYGGAKIFDSHSACRHAIKLPLGADIVIDGTLMKRQPRDAITIAVWVQLNKVDGLHSIFDTVGGHSTHNLGQFHFEVVGGDVRWFHRNESQVEIFSIITDRKMIRPMEWNHIAATYDANSGIAAIFVNGSLAVTGRGKGLISKDWEQRVGIGRHKGVRFLDGQIDEFKMYDIVLDPREIADLASKCGHDKYYCGITLTEPSGSFTSPSYPEYFSGPVQCEWNIEARNGEIISLDMRKFQLGWKGSCGRGTLEVRDRISDSLIGSYCGRPIIPRTVKSHSNHLYVKYITPGAFKGETFKIDYVKEKKNVAKKTLANQCKTSAIMKNVTLIGGAKAGNFSDLGYVVDMDDCVDRCCNSGECDVAFMIDDNCYSVKCTNAPLCKTRPAKASSLRPQLAFVSIAGQASVITSMIKPMLTSSNREVSPSTSVVNPSMSEAIPLCPHTATQTNVTLIGGIKSGNFTSHGVVDNFDDCIKYCCDVDTCDVAFMVKKTCFSLKCANDALCKTRLARPSPYNPMVSFMKKMRPSAQLTEQGATKGKIIAAAKPDIKSITTSIETTTSKLQTCKDLRVSKVYLDVTLKGGINSGEFTDKGHVTSIDECTAKCCAMESCNVAFVIKDTCFAVKCKSYVDCELKPAVSEYYNPKIVYVSWSPPKNDLGDGVPYSYRGCWKDFDITAFAVPLLEGTDSRLSEPYKKRTDPVGDCASVSQSKNFKVFAIQNGGACFSGEEAEHTYQRYGKSEACKGGKGGPFANSVYKSFDDGSIIALGCWADLQDRAFRRMEKNDPLLKDSIDSRADPIGICAKVAEKLKINHFALQKGGQCFVAKDNVVTYDKYSPSRKCKYGLGGQMANDVYQLKMNFTDNAVTRHNISTINATSGSLSPDEIIYKEETSGNDLIRYVYKYDKPMDNVTLMSAINAGTFEDKGKMDHMQDCIKACGESTDCDVAFMLSSQCFNVHCYSPDTCKVKPAFSSFYKPQLAYVHRRLVKSSKNETGVIAKSDCAVNSEASNVTFIEGINAGNFSDMGHADDMTECKSRCCQDPKCNIAFLIQADCYGVRCYSKESCKTRAAKNAALFQPKMVLIRPVSSPLDESIQQKVNSFSPTTTAPTNGDSTDDVPSRTTPLSTTPTTTTTTSPPPVVTKCNLDMWDGHVASNQTLIGGINAGDFRDHGQVDSMTECMGYCCGEQDCDLSFMIDKDCYTVKCYKPSLCKTRNAKPTTFTPQIAFKASSKSAIDKADLSDLLPLHNLPSPENETAELAFAAFRSILFGLPDKYNESSTSKLRPVWTNQEVSRSFNGINEALDFVQDTVTELTTDKDSLEHPFSILYSGLSTTPTAPSSSPTNPSSTNHKTHTIIPRPGTTPSSSALHPSSQATPTFGDPKKHSCRAEPIIYNATLRLGMHSGLFTKLGRVKTMDDCIERCCRSSNADVAYMLGPFCFAVKCRTREMCKPSPAMYSDISSLNLNPAISFLSKDKMIPVIEDNMLLDKAFHTSDDDLIAEVAKNLSTSHSDFLTNLTTMTVYDDFSVAMAPAGINRAIPTSVDATCADSPITYNVTLRGGVHAGKFTELGEGISMRSCVGKCCDTPLCDVAFMFSDKCYAVGCYDEAQCQAVLAKPSSLNPKLAYVTKYRSLGMTALDVIPSGIEFDVKQDDYCVTNLQHGPVYTNKTLFGGMKAGNFSFLGNVNDMASCLRKCCSHKDCDMAYLVNRQQCFSVKCYTPELCQIADEPLKQRMIEISKLVRPKKRSKRRLSRGRMLAYIGIGLIIITSGLTGMIWAALLYVKRSRLRSSEQDDMDSDIPRPDR